MSLHVHSFPMSVAPYLDRSLRARREGAGAKYEQLRDMFVNQLSAGELKPGDPLPPEPVIAEQMSVARSTVRQALAQLEQSGLIRRVRGRGTFIHDDAHNRLR